MDQTVKILITGSAGLVGSACVELFREKGWEVVGIDNNGRSSFFGTPKKDIWFDVDIRDQKAIENLFINYDFNAIIHAAAQPSHDYATDHIIEDFEVNARGTLNLLEAAHKYAPNAAFVYVSTDKVYGENMSVESYQYPRNTNLKETATRYDYDVPFNEDLELDFAGIRSFFGCSKAAADMYAQEYAARFGMKVGIFRPGCITGKNHEGAEQHGFLAYLTKCIREGKVYKIFGNGKTVRDQIHANDLANAFYHYIKNPTIGGVYNIGGGPDRAVSVLEAGNIIGLKLGMPFLHEFHEKRIGDRDWDVHDVSKFRRDYPEWDYQYSLEDIITDLCA